MGPGGPRASWRRVHELRSEGIAAPRTFFGTPADAPLHVAVQMMNESMGMLSEGALLGSEVDFSVPGMGAKKNPAIAR